MRTQRRPVCSSVEPVSSARASSASEMTVRSSSADRERPLDDACRARTRWAGRSPGPVTPRRERRRAARTSASGPMMPIPARPSASGACSRNSAASSTSSSTNDGWRWSASARATGTDSATSRANADTSSPSAATPLGAVGHLHGERCALPHVGGRAPPAGIGLVDELEHDRPRVERILRHDQPHPPFDDVASGRPLAGAVKSTPDRVDVLAAHGAAAGRAGGRGR